MRVKYGLDYSRPGIYRIVCRDNGKSYIGQSVNVGRRVADHRQSLRRGDHKNKHLQNAFNKYGEGSFSVVYSVFCAVEDLTRTEQYVVDLFSRHGGVFNNKAPVDTPMLGVKRKDRDKCVATLAAHREAAIAAWREKVSTDSDLRQLLSDNGKLAMQKLRANSSIEDKRKCNSAAAQRRPDVIERKRAVMLKRIADGWVPNRENPYSIAVTNIDTGEVFTSYQAAANKYGVSPATVHRWVNGRRDGRSKNTVGKPNWRVYEPQNV